MCVCVCMCVCVYYIINSRDDLRDAVLKVNPEAVMVIKSTIPVGYTRSLYVKYACYTLFSFFCSLKGSLPSL